MHYITHMLVSRKEESVELPCGPCTTFSKSHALKIGIQSCAHALDPLHNDLIQNLNSKRVTIQNIIQGTYGSSILSSSISIIYSCLYTLCLQFFRKTCIGRFQLVTIIGMERGISIERGWTTWNLDLNRETCSPQHHSIPCVKLFTCIHVLCFSTNTQSYLPSNGFILVEFIAHARSNGWTLR